MRAIRPIRGAEGARAMPARGAFLAPLLALGVLVQSGTLSGSGLCGMDTSGRGDGCFACAHPVAPVSETPACHGAMAPDRDADRPLAGPCCQLSSGPLAVHAGLAPAIVAPPSGASGSGPDAGWRLPTEELSGSTPRFALARGAPLANAPPDLYRSSFLRL